MTIYDALSQEHILLIYHDYLIDNNHELLADMCLNRTIESTQAYPRSGSRTGLRSKSGTYIGCITTGKWSTRTRLLAKSQSKVS